MSDVFNEFGMLAFAVLGLIIYAYCWGILFGNIFKRSDEKDSTHETYEQFMTSLKVRHIVFAVFMGGVLFLCLYSGLSFLYELKTMKNDSVVQNVYEQSEEHKMPIPEFVNDKDEQNFLESLKP